MSNLTFTEAEREFYEAFVRILTHLQNRAIKAEREVEHLRKELATKREQVEYSSIMSSAALLEKVEAAAQRPCQAAPT